ncbi:MAG: transposase [Candidatus Saccharicenans sp.]|jgi:putative transposase|nr:transposase [Candidatus Saccharicenans sp.]MDH7574606.1 transposase [Candidatus Saccharicenans sp.]
MGRIARIVVLGLPHHIIQRGNRNQKVFFMDKDKSLYIDILRFNAAKFNLKIWCYCLMDNHIHLIAVPERLDSLARAMAETHRKYTYMINIRNNWKGFLFQGRYSSFPMDEAYLYCCVRYVERNPVRAGLVKLAEEYNWSSARAHVFGLKDPLLSPMPLTSQIKDWSSFLRGEEKEEDLEQLRKNQSTGRPLGDDNFIEHLEKLTGRMIRKQRPGRPKKTGDTILVT